MGDGQRCVTQAAPLISLWLPGSSHGHRAFSALPALHPGWRKWPPLLGALTSSSLGQWPCECISSGIHFPLAPSVNHTQVQLFPGTVQEI